MWFIVTLTLLAFIIDLPNISFKILNRKFQLNFPLKLGLDLQGGTQLILEAQMDKIAPLDRDSALESVKNVLEKRVNLYGVSEAIVQSSKIGETRRILVELPGLKDASSAASLVGKTAQLEFRELVSTPSAEASQSAMAIFDAFKPTDLTGADLKRASVIFGGGSTNKGGPQVSIEFTTTGAEKFAQITRRNINKPLGMFLDGVPISWPPPIVQQEILGGSAVITGQFSLEEAKNLAIQLNAGALPVPIKIVQQRSIGATLGQESINKSLIAGIIGLGIVAFYMIFSYGVLGIVADLALIIYTILVLAIFKTGFFILPPITLTLSGIAGFILSVGMAVDANILIFERMKEEIRWGKSKSLALDLGFKRAWGSIWASNVSSLITAVILYSMGQSLVRAFAITLAIGVLVSMFTAIVVSRTLLKLIIK